MTDRRYSVPRCIGEQCGQSLFSKWLHRKATAHARRDRKRGRVCTVAQYQTEIHAAICDSGHLDYYTGEPRNWSLISTYDNDSAKSGRTKYKETLAYLPTVDHTLDERGDQKFVICSWYVNDAKSDLTLTEFYELCERVLKYRGEKEPSPSLKK
jgi:hypothetical protein